MIKKGDTIPGIFSVLFGVLILAYIKTNEKMETNVPGIYAAGDVRVTPLRQVVTACADGAIAAMQCGKYINTLK